MLVVLNASGGISFCSPYEKWPDRAPLYRSKALPVAACVRRRKPLGVAKPIFGDHQSSPHSRHN
jgi:hypothetical protein